MADSRTRKDAYMESLKENLTGVSPQNQVSPQSGGSETPDYYEKLKNESYKALLKGEVQAYNAKQQAMKYTNNGLVANGYGTQGISESANLGIGNTYQKALRDSQNEYDQSILAIDNQQKEAVNSEFESLATLMSSASSSSQLDNVLKEYGITIENGQFSGDYFDSLDDASKRQLRSLYALYSDELQQSEVNNPTFYDEDDLRYATYTKADGSTATIGSHYNEEVKDIMKYSNDGTLVVDGVVRVRNGEGDTIYVKRTSTGWQIVSRNEFEKAEHRYSLKKNGDKTNTWSQLS